jgi:alginate O-acetyltransferase complex protein AlgI
VGGSLTLLGFFKYAGMLSTWLATLGGFWPGGSVRFPLVEVGLPIGISFYVFHAISYAVDVRRGHAEPAPGLVTFAAYMALFPQLVAGPIVRYAWIARELVEREYSLGKFWVGLRFFTIGLAKKVLLADLFALAVPAAFDAPAPSAAGAWLGVLSYTLQIYFDFSAYSDMSIGLGLMIGFHIPENFNSPYKSASITEFWRRWHMSLSSFLRDYLYIPLGGNRKGSARTYENLIAVMLLGGLWHGASVLFVLWGAWHGALLATERLLGPRHPIRLLPRPVAIAVTSLLVVLGWVVFRSGSVESALAVYRGLLVSPFVDGMGVPKNVDVRLWWAVPAGFAICWFLPNSLEMKHTQSLRTALATAMLLALALATVLARDSSPFLYFQF